jgi:hypothetical protein
MKLLEKLKRIAFLPFDRSDRIPELEGRTVENDDAASSALSTGGIPANFPPNYVRDDDGRPRY